jgi:vacuolar-type H+-ATPase subunit I/STV1
MSGLEAVESGFEVNCFMLPYFHTSDKSQRHLFVNQSQSIKLESDMADSSIPSGTTNSTDVTRKLETDRGIKYNDVLTNIAKDAKEMKTTFLTNIAKEMKTIYMIETELQRINRKTIDEHLDQKEEEIETLTEEIATLRKEKDEEIATLKKALEEEMAKVKLLRSCAETQWDRAPAGEVKGDTLG